MSYTDEQLIAQHLKIKGIKAALEAEFETKKKELNRMLQAIEGLLNARLLALPEGERNISTDAGTVFHRTNTYVRVSDKQKLLEYLVETGDISFLDPDVSRDGVETFMKENNGHTPPGVSVTKIQQTVTRT